MPSLQNKKVGIFRFDLCLPSETFISEQARGLSRYTPFFFGRQLMGQAWSVGEIATATRFGNLSSKLFSLYPSLHLFQNQKLIDSANIIHSHFGPDAVYALALAKQLNKPLISTFHGFDVLADRAVMAQQPGLRFKRYLSHEAELKASGNCFLAVSEHVRHALLRLGYPENKIIQHYIGVDTDRFSPGCQDKNIIDVPYVLSVARHVHFKGIPTLLRAFKQVLRIQPELLLVQVGAGPEFENNRVLASELGIDRNVRFLGRQDHDTVLSLMRGAMCFCGPSETAPDGSGEALGIVFCEASACGTPVVSTFNGGIPEVVEDGVTGRLVQEKRPDLLAEAILDIVSDQHVRNSLAHNARMRMVEQFDIKAQSASLEEIYDKVIAGTL